ncbi:hypothetical protein [Roseovarius aestuarii]|uniref:Uncharacterized protein n=1 Tax=Roseovarius aestuarii TaxID=475083 RepID=A0A1X7BML6_9RHOB|nr:hypothetical protein [Roseovarius aestuarii]SMC10878.1 hypothetical protein ROA7745_00686 [Roseovarius aestuarii]
MIPFLTEIAEFIVALLMLAATQPFLKKSVDVSCCVIPLHGVAKPSHITGRLAK